MKYLVALCLLVSLMGCAGMRSHKQPFAEIEEKIGQGNYAAALAQVEAGKNKFYQEKDRVLYFLDAGMLLHYNANYTQSNEYLTQAEYAIEELFTKSISRGAASVMLNDNVLEYAGEDYEDVYLNLFKAINFLEIGQFDAAFVEVRRINNKLNVLSDRYDQLAGEYNTAEEAEVEFKPGESRFHNSALARYMSMLMYRTEGNIDAARIDRNLISQAFETQAQLYNFSKPELDSHLSFTEQAKLNVMAFTGRGPDKKARTLYIHTEKDHIIIATTAEVPSGRQDLATLDVIRWPGVSEGYHFKFQLPVMELRSSNIDRIRVVVDNNRRFELQKMENIERIAEDMFRRKEPLIYLKTITRAVVKGLLSEKAKGEMTSRIDNPLLAFAARMATDVAVDATENADLRISRFFPAYAYVGEIDLQPGVYDIRVDYLNRFGGIVHSENYANFQVRRNGLNFIPTFHLN
jgi:hypothetical protein